MGVVATLDPLNTAILASAVPRDGSRLITPYDACGPDADYAAHRSPVENRGSQRSARTEMGH